MDQARDDAAAFDHSREIERPVGVVQWGSLAAGLVSPTTVIVPLVVGQHPSQVPLTVDQQMVEALAPQCAHESFGVGVRTRRPRRCFDDPYPAAGEHFVVLENLPSRSLIKNVNWSARCPGPSAGSVPAGPSMPRSGWR